MTHNVQITLTRSPLTSNRHDHTAASAPSSAHEEQLVQGRIKSDARILLVVGSRLARLYTTTHPGSTPVIIKHSDQSGRPVNARTADDSSFARLLADNAAFVQAMIAAIRRVQAPSTILVFVDTLTGNQITTQLLAELRSHHPELHSRILGCPGVELQHLSENQVLAAAREFYAANKTLNSRRQT